MRRVSLRWTSGCVLFPLRQLELRHCRRRVIRPRSPTTNHTLRQRARRHAKNSQAKKKNSHRVTASHGDHQAMEAQLLQMFDACAEGSGAPFTSYLCNAAGSVYSLLPYLVKGMVVDVVKLTLGEQLSCGTDPSFACALTVDFSTLVTAIIFGGGLVMMITTSAWPLISPRMREARRRAGQPRPRFRDFGEDYDAYIEDLCGWLGIEGPGWLQEGLHGPIDPPPPAARRQRGRTPPRRRQLQHA